MVCAQFVLGHSQPADGTNMFGRLVTDTHIVLELVVTPVNHQSMSRHIGRADILRISGALRTPTSYVAIPKVEKLFSYQTKYHLFSFLRKF